MKTLSDLGSGSWLRASNGLPQPQSLVKNDSIQSSNSAGSPTAKVTGAYKYNYHGMIVPIE